jgi:hypothetical protein
MQEKEISLKRINALIETIGNLQLAIEPEPDAQLNFRMWGGKDASGEAYKFLGKNKPASVQTMRVLNLSGTGTKYVGVDNLGNLKAMPTPSGDGQNNLIFYDGDLDVLDVEGAYYVPSVNLGDFLIDEDYLDTFTAEGNVGMFLRVYTAPTGAVIQEGYPFLSEELTQYRGSFYRIKPTDSPSFRHWNFLVSSSWFEHYSKTAFGKNGVALIEDNVSVQIKDTDYFIVLKNNDVDKLVVLPPANSFGIDSESNPNKKSGARTFIIFNVGPEQALISTTVQNNSFANVQDPNTFTNDLVIGANNVYLLFSEPESGKYYYTSLLGGGGGGGTSDHRLLTFRNSPDQHTMDSITGLLNALNFRISKDDVIKEPTVELNHRWKFENSLKDSKSNADLYSLYSIDNVNPISEVYEGSTTESFREGVIRKSDGTIFVTTSNSGILKKSPEDIDFVSVVGSTGINWEDYGIVASRNLENEVIYFKANTGSSVYRILPNSYSLTLVADNINSQITCDRFGNLYFFNNGFMRRRNLSGSTSDIVYMPNYGTMYSIAYNDFNDSIYASFSVNGAPSGEFAIVKITGSSFEELNITRRSYVNLTVDNSGELIYCHTNWTSSGRLWRISVSTNTVTEILVYNSSATLLGNMTYSRIYCTEILGMFVTVGSNSTSPDRIFHKAYNTDSLQGINFDFGGGIIRSVFGKGENIYVSNIASMSGTRKIYKLGTIPNNQYIDSDVNNSIKAYSITSIQNQSNLSDFFRLTTGYIYPNYKNILDSGISFWFSGSLFEAISANITLFSSNLDTNGQIDIGCFTSSPMFYVQSYINGSSGHNLYASFTLATICTALGISEEDFKSSLHSFVATFNYRNTFILKVYIDEVEIPLSMGTPFIGSIKQEVSRVRHFLLSSLWSSSYNFYIDDLRIFSGQPDEKVLQEINSGEIDIPHEDNHTVWNSAKSSKEIKEIQYKLEELSGRIDSESSELTEGKLDYILLVSGQSFNSLVQSGFYIANNVTLTNGPSGAGLNPYIGFLLASGVDSSQNSKYQIFFSAVNGKIHKRKSSGFGVWDSWGEMLDANSSQFISGLKTFLNTLVVDTTDMSNDIPAILLEKYGASNPVRFDYILDWIDRYLDENQGSNLSFSRRFQIFKDSNGAINLISTASYNSGSHTETVGIGISNGGSISTGIYPINCNFRTGAPVSQNDTVRKLDLDGVSNTLNGLIGNLENELIAEIETKEDEVLDVSSYQFGNIQSVSNDYSRGYKKYGELVGTNRYHGSVFYNNKVYFIPRNATSVLVFDTITKTLHSFGNIVGTGKYCGGVVTKEGMIYCIPFDAQQVLKIDTGAETASLIGSTYSGEAKWRSGCLAGNGKIYCPPSSDSRILVIEPSTDTTSTISLGGIETLRYSSSVYSRIGNKIYCAPFGNQISSILAIDPTDDSFQHITTPTLESVSLRYGGGCVSHDGKNIMFAPLTSSQVLNIEFFDDGSNMIKEITLKNLGFNSDATKFSSCNLGTNGKVYFIPYNNNHIVEYDYLNGTVKNVCQFFGDGLSNDEKFECAVSTENGSIILCPRNFGSVVEFKRSGMPGNIQWALSNVFNKY